MPLSYKTHRATVLTALLDLVTVALRARLPAVADAAALRLAPTRGPSSTQALTERAVRYVTGLGACAVWRPGSTATDDGAAVFAPLDGNGQPGRWHLSTQALLDETGVPVSTLQAGYLRAVVAYQGERTKAEWETRILSKRPAVMIQFVGESKEQISGLRGAQAVKWLHFLVWGVSFNSRVGTTAAQLGSPVAAEAAADPGIDRIMGDLEYLLDGTQGAEIGLDGLDFMRFGDVSPAIEDLGHSEFVWTAPLDVRVNVGREDPVRQPLSSLYLQAQDDQARPYDGTVWDPLNYVVAQPTGAGLTVSPGAGFTRSCSDGQAYVGGVLVTVASSPAHAYAPSAATWRDLNPDGSFTYTVTADADTPPPVTPGALRVAVTVADPSGIISDLLLAATSAVAGPQNQVF